MIKTEGKCFNQVAEYLKDRGLSTEGLKIASLGPGACHLIMKNDEVIGEYNHRSKTAFLYADEFK